MGKECKMKAFQKIHQSIKKHKRKREIKLANKKTLEKLQSMYDQHDGFVRSILGKRYIEGLSLWQ